ncbi:C45 family autoproteolytic acyltransferase/hydolase [soil metagenome]
MYGGPLRNLALAGSAEAIGATHGLRLQEPIRAYLSDRLDLAGDPYWAGRSEDAARILEMATETLEYHDRFSGPLYEEMLSMAANAGISPAEAVVVGGFTDLIDLVRAAGDPGIEEDDCTGVVDAENGLVAQTWDMHASAGKYVYMFDIRPDDRPRALVQTTAGCLGQIGMNEAGIAIGINNLTSIGRPGVTWPFVVRKVLETTDLDDAVKVVVDAELAGGHNFMIMGPDGAGCNIEAMPGSSRVTRVETGSFVHTNHCLDNETKAEEGLRNPLNEANSDRRLDQGSALAFDLEAFFADADINRSASNDHEVATCGAVVMKPGSRSMDAVWGQPGVHPWEHFSLE